MTYSYDDAGRRTLAEAKVSGVTTRTVATSYDARGKPATLTDTAGSTVVAEARTYDGNSQLTANTITGGDSAGSYQMVWDTTVAVPRLSETRKNGTTWSRSDYGNQLIAFKAGFFGKWYKLDARSSVINPDNNTNNASGPTAYDPFGTPTGATYYATGYRSEIHHGGLIHLRNRDYDPTVGQFTTQDELDGIDGTATVADPYHYTNNDPFNLADPLGLRSGEPDESNTGDTKDSLVQAAIGVLAKAINPWGSPYTAGSCASGNAAVFVVGAGGSSSVMPCLLVDGHDYGLSITLGYGYGGGAETKNPLKIASLAGSFTGGYAVSNARSMTDLRRWSVCITLAGGAAYAGNATVCLATKNRPPADPFRTRDLSGKWMAYIGGGGGIGYQLSATSEFTRIQVLHGRLRVPLIGDPVCRAIELATRMPACPPSA